MKIQNPKSKQGINHYIIKIHCWDLGFISLLIILWLLVIGFWLLPPSSAFAEEPKAAWATYGMLINDTPGNAPQQNPKIISGREDSFIIVWEDGRSGYYDIYAQRINASGTLLWGQNGIPVCRFPGNQNFPQITADGAGGAIVIWQDYRNGNSDIFAQRINESGQILWDTQGTAVCTAEAGQFAPQLIPDGSSGAIIVWHDYRSGIGEDIYAQRINSQGKVLWQENGIPVSAASGTQWYPEIINDNSGGAIIVWTDGRNSPSDNNIYAQRIDLSGESLWAKDGIPICSVKYNQERPQAIFSEDGAIVAWNDSRAGNMDIYAQKVDLQGNLRWREEGVAVCTAPYLQESPRLSPDGQGGAILAWTDERVEESDIYAQRIYRDGRTAWQENGHPICRSNGQQKKPEIIKSNGNWVIVWEGDHLGKTDLFVQKINPDGTPLWVKNGVSLASADHSQESPVLISTLSGDIIAVWQDNRFGNYDIQAQKISSAGNLLWAKSGVVICNAMGSVVQQNVELINNGQGEIILVFEDARSGFFNIFAQKISEYGNLAWGTHSIPVAKLAANQSNPQIVPDDTGGAIIIWEDYRTPDFPNIRAQRINSLGKKVWESSVVLAQVKSRQTKPLMISDGSGGAIVAWHDSRNVLSLQDIYAQRISGKGDLLWGTNGKIVISANGDQTDMDMISDGSKGAVLAWTDLRRGDRNPDIYAQRIDAQGEPIWQEDGVLICGAPDVQRSPKLIRNGEGGIVIAWTDKGGGSYDVYAQRVNKSGEPYWMTDGISINRLGRTQQNPKFGNKSVLVWEDYRFGNWDIFAGAVDLSGKLSWGEEGVPVVNLPHTQYAPRIIQWKNGSVIVVWEDYRSGQQYEIYIQKLNSKGEALWESNGIKVQAEDGARAPKILTDLSSNSFYVFWEDYSNGGKAIYGQKFIAD